MNQSRCQPVPCPWTDLGHQSGQINALDLGRQLMLFPQSIDWFGCGVKQFSLWSCWVFPVWGAVVGSSLPKVWQAFCRIQQIDRWVVCVTSVGNGLEMLISQVWRCCCCCRSPFWKRALTAGTAPGGRRCGLWAHSSPRPALSVPVLEIRAQNPPEHSALHSSFQNECLPVVSPAGRAALPAEPRDLPGDVAVSCFSASSHLSAQTPLGAGCGGTPQDCAVPLGEAAAILLLHTVSPNESRFLSTWVLLQRPKTKKRTMTLSQLSLLTEQVLLHTLARICKAFILQSSVTDPVLWLLLSLGLWQHTVRWEVPTSLLKTPGEPGVKV